MDEQLRLSESEDLPIEVVFGVEAEVRLLEFESLEDIEEAVRGFDYDRDYDGYEPEDE